MCFVFLQDYQVLNLLGKGGFACVYRARSNKTGQEVAIKMVRRKKKKTLVIFAFLTFVFHLVLIIDLYYVNAAQPSGR